MATPCPSQQTSKNLGCGVQRCCDSTSCDVNVQGPCVCATYGDASPSQAGWNYSFIANCAQNSVTGTPLGTACTTPFGVAYAYSCYCRPRVASDVGSVGDRVPGKAIFDFNSQCTFFGGHASASSPTIISPTPSPTGAAAPPLAASTLIALSLIFILRLFAV